MKNQTLIFVFILLPLLSLAQEEGEKKFGISFSGYVKYDAMYDSRQTIAAREGHFLLYPTDENLDANGDDINAKANFNMLAIQSRLSGSITGPDAFGAETSGKVEGDFFATTNNHINLFRMRHAYVKLSWPATEILMGQYWGALFITDCFPGVLSFNTGAPIAPFSRNPQIRLTRSLFGGIKILAIAQTQRDYVSQGPDGGSSTYLRNSAMPDLHLQLHHKTDRTAAGIGLGYKTIVPRLGGTTTATYQYDEKVSGLSFIGFFSAKTEFLSMKLEGIYGENLADVLMLGGFAAKAGSFDPVTGEADYSPTKNMAVWSEINSNGDRLQVGLFGGYTQNLGHQEEIEMSTLDAIYSLEKAATGNMIQSLFRVSPRVIFISNKVRLGLEGEYTAAAYAKQSEPDFMDEKGVIEGTRNVANFRLLFSAIYGF